MNKRVYLFIIVLGLAFSTSVHSQDIASLSDEDIFATAEENIEKYRKGNGWIEITDASGMPVTDAEVRINQTSHDFMFGALLFDLARDNPDPEREELFKERFLELFNYGILPFYWGGYEYTPGHPRWDRIDRVLSWCEENNITPKGHPLAWTHQAGMPGYVLDLSLEDSEVLLEARILENVAGFDEIEIWDVVNEPVNTVTWSMAHKDKEAKYRYTNDVPINEVADWVEKAYKAAGRANPGKELVLNEFMQIADPELRARFYALVEELLSRNTPVKGLGIQAHEPREEWYSPADVWATLELYSEFGLPLHITEFSPQSKGAEITGGYREGNWTEQTQAEFAEMMYRLCFGHPAVRSINWWGFSDENAWLPGCGITDEDLNPKPVYHTLHKLIKEEWMTRGLTLQSDRNGTASFRGFYGSYEVEVTTRDGRKQTTIIQLEKGTRNKYKIKV